MVLRRPRKRSTLSRMMQLTKQWPATRSVQPATTCQRNQRPTRVGGDSDPALGRQMPQLTVDGRSRPPEIEPELAHGRAHRPAVRLQPICQVNVGWSWWTIGMPVFHGRPKDGCWLHLRRDRLWDTT
jgi:hypothetical protein